MNVNTTFNKVEREYRDAVDEAADRYAGVRRAIRDRQVSDEVREAQLARARQSFVETVEGLREKFGVGADGRQVREFATSEAKSYAPAHGGYPGTVVVR